MRRARAWWRLPSRTDDLLRYRGSLGAPCVGVFIPYYVEGELPAVLSRGGEHPTDDSPCWRFRTLLTLIERDFDRYGPRVRAYWDEFEQGLMCEAEDVEARAVAQRRAGDHDGAGALLSQFMARNVAAMMERLDRLVGELPPFGL